MQKQDSVLVRPKNTCKHPFHIPVILKQTTSGYQADRVGRIFHRHRETDLPFYGGDECGYVGFEGVVGELGEAEADSYGDGVGWGGGHCGCAIGGKNANGGVEEMWFSRMDVLSCGWVWWVGALLERVDRRRRIDTGSP